MRALSLPFLVATGYLYSLNGGLVCVGPSRAIKCYVCASTTHGGCTKEDFKSDEITELDDCTYCQVGLISSFSTVVIRKLCYYYTLLIRINIRSIKQRQL